MAHQAPVNVRQRGNGQIEWVIHAFRRGVLVMDKGAGEQSGVLDRRILDRIRRFIFRCVVAISLAMSQGGRN